jgi:hypothetical protein
MTRFAEAPLLIFLDPFGTALEAKSIVNALRRSSKRSTELLLNFSIESVRRIGGRIYEDDRAKGRSASLRRMDNWLGGDWWREFFLAPALRNNPDRAALAADAIFSKYVERINTASGSRAFVVPIRKQFHHKPIFYLTLFHPNSFALMPFNEAVSLATQDWRHHLQQLDLTEADLYEWKNPPLPGLSRVSELQQVFADDEIAFEVSTIDTIVSSILKTLAEKPSLSMRNDFSSFFGSAVGEGRQTHLRAALKILARDGVIPEAPTGKLDNITVSRTSSPHFR